MSRTALRKILYPVILAALFVPPIWLRLSDRISSLTLLGIGLGLLVLGRMINYPLRHFYRGLRAFKQGRLADAEQLFQQFLADLEQRPWIRHFIWWSYGVYTYNLEAMTWNNLGAIRLHQGRPTEARVFLERATAIDPAYPKPWYNLAAAATGEGKKDEAAVYFEKSRALGYSGGSFDQFLTAVQEAYADINAAGR